MIDVTKLYCSRATTGDAIRYGQKSDGRLEAAEPLTHKVPPSAAERKPIVVWNATRTCNLNCVHCYTDSRLREYSGELTTAEARTMIEDLAHFGVPALLFSGGEPLMRPDLLDLVGYGRERGIRPVLSTNGTLITPAVAAQLKQAGLIYVGISLDGIGPVNDRFRGKKGAFEAAMAGFRNCVEVGQRVGLRLTLTQRNFQDLDAIFDFIEREKINRACFYHLVYAGRGNKLLEDDLTHAQSRQAMDIILRRTEDFERRGLNIDVLTVDNHVDGVYLYLQLLQKDPARAAEVYALLEWNGGGTYSSGVGIGNIDYQGNVHPDQFWTEHTFGNVRQRPFSQIWMDVSNPLMAGLKNRLPLLKGRCADCRWKRLCGGSFRARADKVYGDPWMHDPQCYLTDEEIRRDLPESASAMVEAALPKEKAA
jgi:radical SAM protein with 4Fe4S-binding SPASM domain